MKVLFLLRNIPIQTQISGLSKARPRRQFLKSRRIHLVLPMYINYELPIGHVQSTIGEYKRWSRVLFAACCLLLLGALRFRLQSYRLLLQQEYRQWFHSWIAITSTANCWSPPMLIGPSSEAYRLQPPTHRSLVGHTIPQLRPRGLSEKIALDDP
jgi:hypothetical protein